MNGGGDPSPDGGVEVPVVAAVPVPVVVVAAPGDTSGDNAPPMAKISGFYTATKSSPFDRSEFIRMITRFRSTV